MNQRDGRFAFATKPGAQVERIPSVLGVEGPTSDNDDYRTSASAFVLVIANPLICARFWSHVNTNGPIHPVIGTRCWLWTANVVGHGNKTHPRHSKHGQFTYRLKGQPQVHVYAHRFAWGLTHGPIPDGLQVCHRCDTPPCVNDAHLFLGTQDDNLKDAARKNRFTVPRTRTFSLHERLAIYRAPSHRGICVELAARYGVTKACISTIRRGRFLGSGVWTGTKPVPRLIRAGRQILDELSEAVNA